jgi:hypothetical protein
MLDTLCLLVDERENHIHDRVKNLTADESPRNGEFTVDQTDSRVVLVLDIETVKMEENVWRSPHQHELRPKK